MSGAVAAHAAYNGSGTQGLAVTNKIHDDDGDVMSVFWNKNDTTRQLLYGSSIIEIPASGGGGNLAAGGNQIFTINNDLDAIGDLYLQITTDSSANDLQFTNFDLFKCIKRIEFMVGTQVWHTLETVDMGALNQTEMSEDAFELFTLAMSGGFLRNGTRNSVVGTYGSGRGELKSAASSDVTGVLRVPALSRSFGPKLAKFADISENSYLLAGAPHQAVKIRVYTVKHATLPAAVNNLNLRLFGQCGVMCNEEREQIKAMPMGLPKRIKMSQNANYNGNISGSGPGTVSVTLDLDHFSLFASHIVIYLGGQPEALSIDTAELKLNSSSFSGTLEGPLLTGPATDALGLFSNAMYISRANLTDTFYVFPLASHAYGGSSVPLNRFDNIRMELEISHRGSGDFKVVATCVGETTALYKGGAASLAMY